MRIVTILLVVLMALSMVSGTVSAKDMKAGTNMGIKMVQGRVDSVMAADATKGTKATITVVDEKGVKTVFEITPTTTLYGTDMKTIALSAIRKDSIVKVKSDAIKDGAGIAVSIRLVK